MPAEAPSERETKVRKSFQLEPDEEAWVAAKAAALKVPQAYIVRQAIRAAMAAEAAS